MANEKKVRKEKKLGVKEISLGGILEHPIKLIDLPYEEILEREVKKFGNSGHIPIPSKHIGRKAQVFIRKKEEDKKS